MQHRFGEHLPQIDPSAFVHPSAVLIGQVQVAAHASIWPNTTLRGDDGPIVIGEHTSIQDGSTIHCTHGWSSTRVGARVTVGHNAILHGCTIEDDCLIGMGAIVMDNAVVHSGSIIGAGAVVPPNKIIPANTLMMGNPAKPVRSCGDKEAKMIEMGWRAYAVRGQEYLAMNLAAELAQAAAKAGSTK